MRFQAVATLVAGAFVLAGCGRQIADLVGTNRPPSVEIVLEALPPTVGAARYRVRWMGSDPDGRVVHYLFAVDPVSVDRSDATWKRTTELGQILEFPRGPTSGDGATRREPHVVAVRAVDDRGVESEIRWTAFFEDNQPPVVMVTFPPPGAFETPVLGPNPIMTWTGADPDGQTTTRPVKYKYILLSPTSEFPSYLAISDPDSLRRYYAPGFAGWDSTGPDTTTAQFTNLASNVPYLFVVTGFDEAGDYDPVFSLGKNMARFSVGLAKRMGPELVITGDGLWHGSRGYLDVPSRYGRVQVAGDRVFRFSWFASPSIGAQMVSYRWVIDPYDLLSEEPRTSPKDVRHWSARSLNANEVVLGPYENLVKGETHRLYVEAEDNVGLKTLGVVEYTVIPFRFQNELLIVDDTRLGVDITPMGQTCPLPPQGGWPTAAELDTFLYARGGVPWTCSPSGWISTPGIFAGYDFDTLGTRGLASVTVPLSTLSRYRHVVWLVDGVGATQGSNPSSPITALRRMSSPGQSNALTGYVRGGGKLWIAGGGGAYASNFPWNDNTNDRPTVRFSSASVRDELVPGRMMFDVAAWRSEIRVSTESMASGGVTIQRELGRLEGGGRYAGLPATLSRKTTATDPVPPLRGSTLSDFYRTTAELEYLQVANSVVEDVGGGVWESTLDTLYRGTGGSLTPPETPEVVLMTHYHGPSAPGGVVFSGFNLWFFQRSQCVALVDAVLNGVWGLNRAPTPNPLVDGYEPGVSRPGGGGRRGSLVRP